MHQRGFGEEYDEERNAKGGNGKDDMIRGELQSSLEVISVSHLNFDSLNVPIEGYEDEDCINSRRE